MTGTSESKMKYGQIAGNRHVNTLIYHCFEYICLKDQRKFVKKFRKQPHDSDQVMHTFRELILGAYLSSCNFNVRYDYAVDSKTPDWCILDNKSAVIGIVELTNLHIDRFTENEIERQVKSRGMALVWRDQNKDNIDRLYHCIWNKTQVYQYLAEKLRIPFVVAVFGEFYIALDFEEVQLCLFDKHKGLFAMYPELSGVLFFRESSGRYFFDYACNPNALQMIKLFNRAFPPNEKGKEGIAEK